MPNEAYQALFGASDEDVRERPARRRSRAPSTTPSRASSTTTDDVARARPRPRRPRPRRRPRRRSAAARADDRPADRRSSPTRSRATDSRSPDDRRTTPPSSPASRSTRFRESVGLDARHRVGRASRRGPAEGELLRGRAPAGSTAASDRRPRRFAVPASLTERDRGRDLDAGGVRPRPARPLARRGRGRAARHGVARRVGLDEPRRLDQQGRRLGAGRGARLRRDGGLAAEVARRRRRAATSSSASPR